MREVLVKKNILPADQRKFFMQLFTQFLESRQKKSMRSIYSSDTVGLDMFGGVSNIVNQNQKATVSRSGSSVTSQDQQHKNDYTDFLTNPTKNLTIDPNSNINSATNDKNNNTFHRGIDKTKVSLQDNHNSNQNIPALQSTTTANNNNNYSSTNFITPDYNTTANIIDAFPEDKLLNYEKDISPCPEDQALRHELLNKLAVLKLNGGLGSTMGCTLPKSAIEVRQDMSFLDMSVRQIEYFNTMYGVDVPLILMNSFKTNEVTMKLINKYRMHNLTIHTFMQSCFPRILKDTLLPLPSGPFTAEESNFWYPPGHGDLYYSLYNSGLLDSLIEQGKEYMFVSNVDNLGATVDLNILYHLVDSDIEYCLCAVKHTRADTDGGLLGGQRGKPVLVELSQLSETDANPLRKKLPYFNTNNCWINLKALHALMTNDELSLKVVVNERMVEGLKTLQLETIIGHAVSDFNKVVAVDVPRSRYLPVKGTSDLFLIQSNLFSLLRGTLIINPQRPYPSHPLIKLGETFRNIDEYAARIKYGVPNILELEHLTVAGDVTFGRNVTLKGTVIIVANEGSLIMIPDGTILEDKVVTGNLRLLDH